MTYSSFKLEGGRNLIKSKFIGTTLALSILLIGCGDGEETGNGEETQDNGGAGDEPANVGEEVDYTVVGIEPGAGAMGLAETAMEEYENLEGWELIESSTAGMMTELGEAMNNEEPIVVVGWNPHYKFALYDLKYLEDPQGSFGEEDDIHTMTRLGLEEDMPLAYEILDRFYWDSEDMEEVMLEAQDSSIEEAASNWVEENQDQVNEWIEGVETVDGESIELVLTPWDSERASGEVMRLALEEQGFDVTLTPVDPAVVFQALASGDADASLAPWIPVTHGDFYEEYQEDIVDLGANLTGARIGFAVPEYMDIESIEDLQPQE